MIQSLLPNSEVKVYNILNLGAGWQSSRILLGSCLGQLPSLDAAVFADSQWEPKAVYDKGEFLKLEAALAGIPLAGRTAGPIRAEILEFMQSRKHLGRKRYASAPMFIKNLDGSQGRMKRQCTKEYKIEVVEKWIRRVFLALVPRQRIPGGILVRQWFGISDDEASRATFPGVYKAVQIEVDNGLFGEAHTRPGRKWMPVKWRNNVYPLLNEVWRPDRTIVEEQFLPRREQRYDCGAWLKKHFPGQTFPRSACVGCPFRSNEEWRDMRDNRPEEWADACEFDDLQRQPDAASASKLAMLVGVPYVHRQMVPLRMVDLDGAGEKGGGCGTLYDGMDGMCDV